MTETTEKVAGFVQDLLPGVFRCDTLAVAEVTNCPGWAGICFSQGDKEAFYPIPESDLPKLIAKIASYIDNHNTARA